jgi:hypothetical protein
MFINTCVWLDDLYHTSASSRLGPRAERSTLCVLTEPEPFSLPSRSRPPPSWHRSQRSLPIAAVGRSRSSARPSRTRFRTTRLHRLARGPRPEERLAPRIASVATTGPPRRPRQREISPPPSVARIKITASTIRIATISHVARSPRRRVRRCARRDGSSSTSRSPSGPGPQPLIRRVIFWRSRRRRAISGRAIATASLARSADRASKNMLTASCAPIQTATRPEGLSPGSTRM